MDRVKRHKKIRSKLSGTAKRPRLAVFRSSQHIYAQLIDDEKGVTLASASDLKVKKTKTHTKTDIAKAVGKEIAKQAAEKKIKNVVFDRGGHQYHGRVKTLADSAKEGGLEF